MSPSSIFILSCFGLPPRSNPEQFVLVDDDKFACPNCAKTSVFSDDEAARCYETVFNFFNEAMPALALAGPGPSVTPSSTEALSRTAVANTFHLSLMDSSVDCSCRVWLMDSSVDCSCRLWRCMTFCRLGGRRSSLPVAEKRADSDVLQGGS